MKYFKQNRYFSTVFIIFFILVYQNVFSGCNQSESNNEIEESIVEDSTIKGFTTDDFMLILNDFMNKNYLDAYNNFGNGELRAKCSPELFNRYFSFTNKVYGDMSNPKLVTFDTFTDQHTGLKLLTGFDVMFENVSGHLNLALIKESDGSMSISDFRILVTDGEEYPFIKELTSDILSIFMEKDFEKIYRIASQRFRDYTPTEQWNEVKEMWKPVDFSDAKYKNSIIFLDGDQLIASVRFHLINSKKYFLMSFIINDDDTYTLNGVNIFD
jgi:hypothetical protein